MLDYERVFWLLQLLFGLTLLYPWHPTWPKAWWLVHLPLMLVPLWLYYETLMPREMNIRVDLLLIFPEFAVAAAVYLCRLLLFASWRRRRSRESESIRAALTPRGPTGRDRRAP